MSKKTKAKQPTPRDEHFMELLERIAKKLDGGEPLSLDLNERGLAAGALRYLAQHIPEDNGKRGPGRPPSFNHAWAAGRFALLLAQDVKPTAAYTLIADELSASSPTERTITGDDVRMAINAYRKKSTPK